MLVSRCFGAASAKERLDIVVRDWINAGDIPGPRYLANGKEMAVRDGELVAGITAFANGPLEMREVIRHHVDLGVDQIKLSMSGEEVSGCGPPPPPPPRPFPPPRGIFPKAHNSTFRLPRLDPPMTAISLTQRPLHVSMRHTNMASGSVPTLAPEIRSRCASSMALISYTMPATLTTKVWTCWRKQKTDTS